MGVDRANELVVLVVDVVVAGADAGVVEAGAALPEREHALTLVHLRLDVGRVRASRRLREIDLAAVVVDDVRDRLPNRLGGGPRSYFAPGEDVATVRVRVRVLGLDH